MPELPEVETIVRTLAPQVVGRAVTAVTLLYPRALQAGREHLPRLEEKNGGGLIIRRVFRRAKLLLLALAPEDPPAAAPLADEVFLAFHLKMTGGFFVHPAGTRPLKHTRLIFDLSLPGPVAAAPDTVQEPDGASGRRLFFDDMRAFGYCRVMSPGQLATWPFWNSLGPEPLDLNTEELAAHLAAVFAGRGISAKAALLDQKIIAGIGNIYADESLFQAGILPSAAVSGLSGERLLSLAGAVQGILRRSIQECGSSIRNYRDALGKAGAFQNSFAVYGRKGQRCKRCDSALLSSRVAGRGTVYCPSCQRA